mmetsp:Transcript_30436/g.98922  ORF Transcript_30436/g.98922 Transcript_30436/m.98922 type:complete len:206 (+) Transcript_30436:189-806(+)
MMVSSPVYLASSIRPYRTNRPQTTRPRALKGTEVVADVSSPRGGKHREHRSLSPPELKHRPRWRQRRDPRPTHSKARTSPSQRSSRHLRTRSTLNVPSWCGVASAPPNALSWVASNLPSAAVHDRCEPPPSPRASTSRKPTPHAPLRNNSGARCLLACSSCSRRSAKADDGCSLCASRQALPLAGHPPARRGGATCCRSRRPLSD